MIDLLRRRRSVRSFEQKDIEPGKVDLLVEALLRSPTSRNLRPWRFILVQDKASLASLSSAKPSGAAFIAEATMAVVICGDEKISDVWIEDCSIAAIILQLAALDLGLGSCWVQIRNRRHSETQSSEAYIQELLGLPSQLRIEAVVALGYPAESKEGIPLERLEREKVFKERFSSSG